MTLSASDAVLLPAACPDPVGGSRGVRRVPHPPRLAPLCLPLSILLLVILEGCSAQLDPVKNFCRRFGHQTAVIDRKLYIDGGFMNYNPLSQYPTNYSNNGLHYHDLDTPGQGRMPQLYTNLTKDPTIPDVHGGTLWADNVNKRFYLFGGEYHKQLPPPEFTLWSFDTLYKDWESFGSPAQDDIGAVSYGAGVSISETGDGYYYGGWKSNNTIPDWADPPKAVSWLVRYNMDSNAWSTNPGPDSAGRAEGAMVFIPIGDGGMLVYLGGVQDHGNGTWAGQPMENIFLYDVLSSKWYTQNATGTVPPMRRRFCAGATWAPDQSSYNIYIYGGAGMPPDTAGFDDVYILTIPSFQWVKMYPTDGNATGAYPHHSLSCDVIDNAQMIIIGGTFPTLDICDAPTQYGVHNLDLGQQNQKKAIWEIFATNLTQYAVPDVLIGAVGGSAGGGATKTAPATGFNDLDMRVLMTPKADIPSRTPTRAIPAATNSPEQDSPLPKGAIAGIAIGSATALLTLIVITALLIRRRRRKHLALNNSTNLQPKPFPTNSSGSPQQEWSSHVPSSPHPHSPYPHSPFLYQHPSEIGYQPAELPAPPAPPPQRNMPTTTTWLGPDGVTAVLWVAAPAPRPAMGAGSPTALKGGGSPTATTTDTGIGTGTTANSGGDSGSPQTPTQIQPAKLDSEGRLWVQISPSPSAGTFNPPLTPPVPAPGLGLGLALRHHPPLPSHSPPTTTTLTPAAGDSPAGVSGSNTSKNMEPHELICEEAREGGGARGGGQRGGEGGGGAVLKESAGWDAAHGRPRHLTFYHP